MNLTAEKVESGAGKSEIMLVLSPGLSLFSALPDSPVRGELRVLTPNAAERLFVVAGSTLLEVFSDGTSVARGAVANDGGPVSLANSNIQVMIASGGQGYCYTLATNVLSAAVAQIAGVVQVGYTDGYFVALIGVTAQMYLSGLLDGNTWSGAQTAIVSVFPDNVVSMLVDHREICLLGTKQSQCYYDSGNTFPYDVIPGGFAEQGSAATFGAIKADNTVLWIGQDERGNAVAWRAEGYTPKRISTHAIESAWQDYSTVADVEAYSCQLKGHTFVVWYFPTVSKTWAYDISTGLWAEWGFWDVSHGVYTAHRSRCHAFAFNKHLVGDWASGNIYQMSFEQPDGAGGWLFCDDFGNPKRWARRSPYVGVAGVWNYFSAIEFMLRVGIGPSTPLLDGAGVARAPQATLQWSNDAANTWMGNRMVSIGQIGKYMTRAIVRRLGRCWGSFGRVFELSGSDPVPIAIIDADLTAEPQMKPQKRLAAELRERA